MPAQIEEVVVDADLLQLEHFRPDLREQSPLRGFEGPQSSLVTQAGFDRVPEGLYGLPCRWV